MTNTYGPAYDEKLDGPRVKNQLERIRDYMLSVEWKALHPIAEATGDPESSVSAQLRHLRKERFGSYIVEKKRGARGLWHYRLLRPVPEKQGKLF